jgi:alkyl sulfatase BDS1-like metallo-beta-lactamase superfamily hydrolase
LAAVGNAKIQEVLRAQRGIYAHMNNQVLHLANQGVTINQIHNVYEVPKFRTSGSVAVIPALTQHNSRGVIQRYLGFWDCNPRALAAKRARSPISTGIPQKSATFGNDKKAGRRIRSVCFEGR